MKLGIISLIIYMGLLLNSCKTRNDNNRTKTIYTNSNKIFGKAYTDLSRSGKSLFDVMFSRTKNSIDYNSFGKENAMNVYVKQLRARDSTQIKKVEELIGISSAYIILSKYNDLLTPVVNSKKVFLTNVFEGYQKFLNRIKKESNIPDSLLKSYQEKVFTNQNYMDALVGLAVKTNDLAFKALFPIVRNLLDNTWLKIRNELSHAELMSLAKRVHNNLILFSTNKNDLDLFTNKLLDKYNSDHSLVNAMSKLMDNMKQLSKNETYIIDLIGSLNNRSFLSDTTPIRLKDDAKLIQIFEYLGSDLYKKYSPKESRISINEMFKRTDYNIKERQIALVMIYEINGKSNQEAVRIVNSIYNSPKGEDTYVMNLKNLNWDVVQKNYLKGNHENVNAWQSWLVDSYKDYISSAFISKKIASLQTGDKQSKEKHSINVNWFIMQFTSDYRIFAKEYDFEQKIFTKPYVFDKEVSEYMYFSRESVFVKLYNKIFTE